ncbi:pilus modification protein PilQ [Stutzerimonas kirkiae]|uniref:Pilus modification protein PilQ n=1 Tax=Stutzerimonas kirkiae TaxID=2211392 RepID=A0A4Q9R114_9GAMM|nr:pilus modification protein PilQ [Stutzerimonas kirkiae]
MKTNAARRVRCRRVSGLYSLLVLLALSPSTALSSTAERSLPARSEAVVELPLEAGARGAGDERISLNFQDIEVRAALQIIADFSGLNLVASDSVKGNITLRLQQVPREQALELVLRSKGLGQRREGGVLLVAPLGEFAERERQALETRRQLDGLSPRQREVLQINYARAADIASLFQSAPDEEASQGASRGAIAVDERSNSIIAYLSRERLEELRGIVAQLDIPIRQVMIEARIVEASVDYDRSLGVRWGGNIRAGDSWGVWGGGGLLATSDTALIALPENSPFVDMGAVGASSGIGLGFVGDNALLDLQLSAMEKSGNGEVVSQPRVVTADKETARVLKGAEVPYQTTNTNGATNTSFREASLSLEVTPQITPDNRIIMAVRVTKDEPDFSQAATTGVPAIRKNEVNAKVLVADEETIVIGGVFSNTRSKSVDKVPLLGDIPLLGRLFRRELVQDRKSELLVFITPRIMGASAIAVNR